VARVPSDSLVAQTTNCGSEGLPCVNCLSPSVRSWQRPTVPIAFSHFHFSVHLALSLPFHCSCVLRETCLLLRAKLPRDPRTSIFQLTRPKRVHSSQSNLTMRSATSTSTTTAQEEEQMCIGVSSTGSATASFGWSGPSPTSLESFNIQLRSEEATLQRHRQGRGQVFIQLFWLRWMLRLSLEAVQ
jgi:hypothetical protein